MIIKNHLLCGTSMPYAKWNLTADDGNEQGGGAGGGAPAGFKPATQDNSGGNSGEPAPKTGESNNTGQKVDTASFWDNAGAEGEQQTTQVDGAALGTQLATALTTMSFGNGIVDAAVEKELAEGNYTSFNDRLQGMGREIAKQTLGMNVQVIKAVKDQIMNEVRAIVGGELGNRDNSDALVKAFPSAADPAIRPVVQNIFNRAMTLSKGNREAAIGMTREMLKLTAGKVGADTGLSLAPSGPGDSAPVGKTDWLEDLMG